MAAFITLLMLSNVFMTLAWYGHLKFQEWPALKGLGLPAIILISWSVALLEYCFQVPANRIGYNGHGGPFSLIQLKVLQEAMSLLVFVGVSRILFSIESLRWNHLLAFAFLIAAAFLVFYKK